MVTGTLQVFYLHVYALLDPETSLYFVTPNIADNFDVSPESLVEPFSVFTPVGVSIVANNVYMICLIIVS